MEYKRYENKDKKGGFTMIDELLERKPIVAVQENFIKEYYQKNAHADQTENGDMLDNFLDEMHIKERIESTNMVNQKKFQQEVKKIEDKYVECVKVVDNSSKSDFKKNKEKKTLAKEKTEALKKANKNYNNIPNFENRLERIKYYDMNLLASIKNSQNDQIKDEGRLLSRLSEEDRIHALNNPNLIGLLDVNEVKEIDCTHYNRTIINNFKENSTVADMVSGCSAVIKRIKQYNNKDGPEAKINPSQPYDHERFIEWKVAYNMMNLLEFRADVKIELQKTDPEGYLLLEFTAKRFELYKNYIDLQVANSILPSIEKNLNGVRGLDYNLKAFREKQKNLAEIPGVSLNNANLQEFKLFSDRNAMIDFEEIERRAKEITDNEEDLQKFKDEEIAKFREKKQDEANKSKDIKQLELCILRIKEDAKATSTYLTPEAVKENAQLLLNAEKNVRKYLNGKIMPNIEFDQMVDIYLTDYTVKFKELKDDSVASEYALGKLKDFVNNQSIHDKDKLVSIKEELKNKNPDCTEEFYHKEAQKILATENYKKASEYKAVKLQGIRDENRKVIEERGRKALEERDKKRAEEKAKADAEALEREKIIDEAKEVARKKATAEADLISNQREENIKAKRAELLKASEIKDTLILNKNLDHSQKAIDKMAADDKSKTREDIIKLLTKQAYTESDAIAKNDNKLMTQFQDKIGRAMNSVGLQHVAELHRAMALKCFYEYKIIASEKEMTKQEFDTEKEFDNVIDGCWKELRAIKAIETAVLNAEKATIQRLDEEKEKARKQKK